MYAINNLQQVLDFFTSLIRSLGNDIEFVVKPTLHDGMNIGVSWRLGLLLLPKLFGNYKVIIIY